MGRSRLLSVIVVAFLLNGCAVAMALHGKKQPNLASLHIGQPRELVLLNIGQPSKTILNEAGRVDVFELEPDNAPSAGRALGHASLDVVTLGAWELFGTPMETIASGDKLVLTVEYDEQEKVKRVSTGEPGAASL